MEMLLVTDGYITAEEFKTKEVAPLFDHLKAYQVNTDYAVDDGLTAGGFEFIKAVHEIEVKGPEWVKQSKEFLDKLESAEIALVHFSAAGTNFINAAKNLKLLGVLRSGVENVNVPLCTEKGIIVCNTPGRVSEPVADFALAMILSANRFIPHNELTHHKGFDADIPWNPKLMKDMTVGLIGFGVIGKKVAQRLSGFGTKVIAYDPYAKEEDAEALGVKLLPIKEVMGQADIVSVHARLLPATKNMIGAKELSYMKPDGILVNTARGGLIDEEALIKTLQEKKIRCAALDVFASEPLPDDHILRTLDNVVLTPHMAGIGGNMPKMASEIMLAEIERFVKGEKLQNRIN